MPERHTLPPGRIRMFPRPPVTPPVAPQVVPVEPAAPPVPQGGPPPGRARLPARPTPPPLPELPPLNLAPRRPNPAREAFLAREARERAALLQRIADRRAREGLAPLGLTGPPTSSAVHHDEEDPVVAALLQAFPGAQVVAVREVRT